MTKSPPFRPPKGTLIRKQLTVKKGGIMRIFFCRKWKRRHPGAAKYKTQLGCWGQCCLCPAVVLHWRGPGVCFGQFWGFLISFHKFLFPENSTADSTVNNKEFELILSSKFNLVQCAKTQGMVPLSVWLYE